MMKQSLFYTDQFGLSTSRTRQTGRRSIVSRRAQKIPNMLWRCSLSACSMLLSRDRSGGRPVEGRTDTGRRNTVGAVLSTASRSPLLATQTQLSCPRQLATTSRLGSGLLGVRNKGLHLFRDEAEYSDYLSAFVTGQHFERPGDGVIFYELETHLSKQHWRVMRRFSEFRALRQQLIKHFSRNNRRSAPRCAICENVLASIVATIFPSRHVWGPHLCCSSSEGALEETCIQERKSRFQEFVAICLRTIRSLRQHNRVMPENTTCEVSVALQMTEEFWGLSFTRYLGFLGERGVVDDMPVMTRHSLPLRQRQEEKSIN
ncbi:unnamed protein product [Hyaloperonospora brassicae]|uniref:PX domain-containing protein n=1 Tax=Hyaloperonospora brassicae TaxID=162125 RepID=A0AAV0V2Q7_HYABA|nr:unnamed protein product [Hyaloperonospora brassicae]